MTQSPPAKSGHASGGHQRHHDGTQVAPSVASTAALQVLPANGSGAPVLPANGSGAPVLPANPHFQGIGGEPGVRALVERFYVHMDQLPQARAIRALHPPDLAPVKETLFKFLTGWLGGPQLYAAERGHPRLRQKHLPFGIGDAERDAWMACMNLALEDVVTDVRLRGELQAAFHKTATFLRNQ